MSITQVPADKVIKRTRSLAHFIERFGLAMVGAACGLFVAAHMAQARDETLASLTVFAAMTGGGAIGFYTGIDIPPHAVFAGKLDPAELISAIGTFLASMAALIAVYMIVDDYRPGVTWTTLNGACWLVGVTMQIVAGTIARIRS